MLGERKWEYRYSRSEIIIITPGERGGSHSRYGELFLIARPRQVNSALKFFSRRKRFLARSPFANFVPSRSPCRAKKLFRGSKPQFTLDEEIRVFLPFLLLFAPLAGFIFHVCVCKIIYNNIISGGIIGKGLNIMKNVQQNFTLKLYMRSWSILRLTIGF